MSGRVKPGAILLKTVTSICPSIHSVYVTHPLEFPLYHGFVMSVSMWLLFFLWTIQILKGKQQTVLFNREGEISQLDKEQKLLCAKTMVHNSKETYLKYLRGMNTVLLLKLLNFNIVSKEYISPRTWIVDICVCRLFFSSSFLYPFLFFLFSSFLLPFSCSCFSFIPLLSLLFLFSFCFILLDVRLFCSRSLVYRTLIFNVVVKQCIHS